MIDQTVKVFKALSDETRMAIVRDFMAGHTTVCPDIKRELSKSQPTLSHHIGILKDAGVIIETKKGVNCNYHVNTDFLNSIGIDLTKQNIKSDK